MYTRMAACEQMIVNHEITAAAEAVCGELR